MAKYTITLREIIYHYTQDKNPYNIQPDANGHRFMRDYDIMSVGERIKKAQEIFLSGVTFADSGMADEFWENFAAKNLMREIEFETVEYFMLRFRAQLNLLLPKYNPLYESTKLEIEKLKSFGKKTHREGKDDTETNTHSDTNSTGSNRSVFEDTPENRLANADYATNITTNNGQDNTNVTAGGTDNKVYSEDVTEDGYNMPQAQLLQAYRETLITVINDLIDDVSRPLFCKIY